MPNQEEKIDKLLSLTDKLTGDALLIELLLDQLWAKATELQKYPKGVPEQTLTHLSRDLTRHVLALQALSRSWDSQSSLEST